MTKRFINIASCLRSAADHARSASCRCRLRTDRMRAANAAPDADRANDHDATVHGARPPEREPSVLEHAQLTAHGTDVHVGGGGDLGDRTSLAIERQQYLGRLLRQLDRCRRGEAQARAGCRAAAAGG